MSQVVMNELVNMSQEIIKLKDQKYALLAALKVCEGRLTYLAQESVEVMYELKTARAAIEKATK